MTDQLNTTQNPRVEEIHARLLQLSRAIPDADRYLNKLRDERLNLTLELRQIRENE